MAPALFSGGSFEACVRASPRAPPQCVGSCEQGCVEEPCGRCWNSPGSLLLGLVRDSVPRHELVEDHDPDEHVHLARGAEGSLSRRSTRETLQLPTLSAPFSFFLTVPGTLRMTAMEKVSLNVSITFRAENKAPWLMARPLERSARPI